MRGNGSPPVTDEYNEDTDKANDSEDDQWEDSKLVIDLDPNSSMNTADSNKLCSGSQSKDAAKSIDDSFTPPEPRAEKPKGKRGVQRKSDKSDAKETASGTKASSKQSKTEKDKPPPNKPGRKRKERPATGSKASNGDVKSPASLGDSSSPADPYKFETEEGISATAAGKHTNKDNKSNPAVMKDAQTDCDWRSVGSVTEPEQLAPCEPGTQVSLEGIVWQETNNGVLIVNVTWRGKTYMGTLLDATKHDWSPPSCDSPVAELEGRTPKGRGKRSRVPLSDTFKDINERKLRKEMRKQSGASHLPASPAKSEQGKRKNRNSEGENGEPTTKRGRTSSRNPSAPTSSSPPVLIECPEPNCGKKYKQMNGLKYHQRNAHQDTASHVSDSLSETEKPESVSSPDENKRTKRKNKGDNKSTTVTPEPKPIVKSEPEESESKSADNTTVTQTNTTSVITSTTTQISNSNQQSNVPVATITPQVVKSNNGTVAEDQAKSACNQQQMPSSSLPTASTNRSLPSAPKLFPKSSGNSMAPISTITSQGVYNPSLKPIQPKPTILGESTPNPTLTDLRDHKKLKRKRSASRDDLTNGTSSPYSEQIKSMTLKSEPEGRPTTQQIPTVLQSPSYSDISEEGEIRNARREMLNSCKTVISDPMCPPPAAYPVATVSPQKNIPPGLDREKPRVPGHVNHSPAPKPVGDDRPRRDMELEQLKQRELEMLKQYGQFQQQMPWPPGITTGIPQDFMQMQQMQLALANRERERQRRSASPRPSIKSSPAPQIKELEAKASSDRLQLLKENKDMKPHGSSLGQQEMLTDFQQMQNPHLRSTEDVNKFLMFQKMQQNQQKRESLQTHSPAHKPTSSKVPEPRPDHSRASRSSPMPPQPGGFMPFMSNPLFQFPGIPGVGSPMPPGFLPPDFPYAAGLLDSKDPIRPGPSSAMFAKPDHKIHELESHRASKSPRPTVDRPHSAKAHPSMPSHSVFSAYSAAAAAGLNGPAMPGLFQPK